MGNNKVHTKAQMQGKKGNGKNDLHPKSRRVKQAVRVELRTKRIGEVRFIASRLQAGPELSSHSPRRSAMLLKKRKVHFLCKTLAANLD
jgi:hypothetical protein